MNTVICESKEGTDTTENLYQAPNGKYYPNKQAYKQSIEDAKYCQQIVSFMSKHVCDTYNTASYIVKKAKSMEDLTPKQILELLVDNVDYYQRMFSDGNKRMDNIAKINIAFGYIASIQNKPSYAGCYEIVNKNTGGKYIGESVNVFERMVTHISDLLSGNHHCKRLQNAFNETRNIQDFAFRPMRIFPITNEDRNIVKAETLYLEAAYYLAAKSRGCDLYNTIDPYDDLKQNVVSASNGTVDYAKALDMLIEDQYKILPAKIKAKIIKNLKTLKIIPSQQLDEDSDSTEQPAAQQKESKQNPKHKAVRPRKTKTVNYTSSSYEAPDWVCAQLKYTKELQDNDTQLYRLTHILQEISVMGYMPTPYDYYNVRVLLQEHGLIVVDEHGNTVATEWALDNHYYCISDYIVYIEDGRKVFRYYITPLGRQFVIKIFENLTAEQRQKLKKD